MLNFAILKNPANWAMITIISLLAIFATSLLTHGVVPNE